MSRISLIVVTLLALEAAAAAQYGPPPPPPPPYAPQPPPPPPSVYGYGTPSPGAHQHEGFYLRLHLGFGGTQAETTDSDTKVSGPSALIGVAVGGAVAENLILYGELFAHGIASPKVSIGGTTFDTASDVSARAQGIGAGLAYYFMPVNVYLSAAIDAFQLAASDSEGDIAETDAGVGLHVMVGKEWWVSDGWGIGIAVEGFVGRIKDNGSGNGSWNAGSLGLVFSATYN